jgi:hypothetical protein
MAERVMQVRFFCSCSSTARENGLLYTDGWFQQNDCWCAECSGACTTARTIIYGSCGEHVCCPISTATMACNKTHDVCSANRCCIVDSPLAAGMRGALQEPAPQLPCNSCHQRQPHSTRKGHSCPASAAADSMLPGAARAPFVNSSLRGRQQQQGRATIWQRQQQAQPSWHSTAGHSSDCSSSA